MRARRFPRARRHVAARWFAAATLTLLTVASSVAEPRKLPLTSELASRSAPTSAVEARVFACTLAAPRSCEIRDVACQTRLFELATCVAARRAQRPALAFVAASSLGADRQRERARRPALDFALEHLGLAEPSVAEPGRDAGPTFTAFYTATERRILVATSGAVPTNSEVASSVLVHEYVHALQDADGTLAELFRRRDEQSFDAELAAMAAVEGEASFYEEAVRAARGQRRIPEALATRFSAAVRYADEHIARQRFPKTASFALFPYAHGSQWATRRLLDGANDAPSLAAAPPASTRALLAELDAWPTDITQSCVEPDDEHFVPRGQRRTAVDTLGAWLVQTLVRKRSDDAQRAERAARALASDRLSAYAGADGRRGFVWHTCWTSPAAADEMRELLKPAAPTTPPLTVEVSGQRLLILAFE